MIGIPEPLQHLFVAAGWQRRNFPIVAAGRPPAESYCLVLIEEFAGLRVGEVGPGSETAASDVRFYEKARPEVQSVSRPWSNQVGNTAAFATAHNDHMILLVNDEGEFLVFTDPDESLYRAGKDFGQLMKALLCGYSLGPQLRRDA